MAVNIAVRRDLVRVAPNPIDVVRFATDMTDLVRVAPDMIVLTTNRYFFNKVATNCASWLGVRRKL